MSVPTTQPRTTRLGFGGLGIQTWAMLVDAYRELNSKKLFWITLILSAIVVAAFGVFGFNAQGVTFFWKTFPSPYLNTQFVPIDQLYKGFFLSLGVQWWLGFLAIILALISTAPLFPEFISGGAIDLYLARPLGRLRLMLTKYMVGLLFVGLQVTSFCVATFFVIGLRGGVWVPGIFLAIPLVVMLFSYLWAICTFFGVLTRSTIAALLLTMLSWFMIFGVHSTESFLMMMSVGRDVSARVLDRDIAKYEAGLANLTTRPATTRPGSFEGTRKKTLEISLEKARTERAGISDSFKPWHTLAYAVKWPLPKTAETTALLERWLDHQFRGPRERRRDGDEDEDTAEKRNSRNFFESREVQRETTIEVDRVFRSRSTAWVLGTSLFSEVVILGLTALIFCRRDY